MWVGSGGFVCLLGLFILECWVIILVVMLDFVCWICGFVLLFYFGFVAVGLLTLFGLFTLVCLWWEVLA